jgi:hypothetical protein
MGHGQGLVLVVPAAGLAFGLPFPFINLFYRVLLLRFEGKAAVALFWGRERSKKQ